MTRILIALLFLTTLAACESPEPGVPAAGEAEAGWQPLFDGQTLNGWRVVGDTGHYYVEDGAIVGVALREGGSYIATERDYDDFELEADVKVDEGFNSGVQIRSRVLDRDTTLSFLNGRLERQERQFKVGDVVGYQVEVDPTERAWSGGLYEPSGRGWLTTLEDKPEAQAAYRADDWNTYRVLAHGDTIRTWLNGVPVVDTTDGARRTGFIALQSHAANTDEEVGHKVYFRNVRIRPLD